MEEAVHCVVTAQQPCGPSASTAIACQEESCPSCIECNESSTNSTPFVSAPSSPRKSTPFAYYLARSTLALSTSSEVHGLDAVSAYMEAESTPPSPSLSEFEFSSRFSEADVWFNPNSIVPPMSTADQLFHNGKIRPLNTRLYPSSYCICFSGAIHHDGYHDPLVHDAYIDGPPAAHAEQQQQQLFMRKQRLGHTKPTSALSALEQWKKSMGSYDKGHSRHAHGHNVERVMQIPSLPLAQYRNGRREGGHHRRARSLSPLRVFHMDDKMMQARASFESEMPTTTKISLSLDLGTTTMRPRRSRKSWTLKELLKMGDNRVHDKRPQLRGNGAESEESRSRSAYVESWEDNVGKRSLAEESLHSKRSTYNEGARSPWNLQQAVEEHADDYYSFGSERAQVEEMKKRNFLPYKKGLLGCLKLNSIKGLQSCMP